MRLGICAAVVISLGANAHADPIKIVRGYFNYSTATDTLDVGVVTTEPIDFTKHQLRLSGNDPISPHAGHIRGYPYVTWFSLNSQPDAQFTLAHTIRTAPTGPYTTLNLPSVAAQQSEIDRDGNPEHLLLISMHGAEEYGLTTIQTPAGGEPFYIHHILGARLTGPGLNGRYLEFYETIDNPQLLIPLPEPSSFALASLGAVVLFIRPFRRQRQLASRAK